MQLVLSVEDTNKIRQNLGLKLIPLNCPRPRVDELKSRALASISEREPKLSQPDLPNGKSITTNQLNAEKQSLPLENDSSENVESTASWLKKMESFASIEASTPPPQQSVESTEIDPIKSDTHSNAATTNGTEIPVGSETPVVTKKTINDSNLTHNAPTSSSSPTNDAAKQQPRVEKKLKEAVFKVKKVKSNASTRRPVNRVLVTPSDADIKQKEREEEAEFEKFMKLSRLRHSLNTDVSAVDIPDTKESFNSVGLLSKLAEKTANSSSNAEISPPSGETLAGRALETQPRPSIPVIDIHLTTSDNAENGDSLEEAADLGLAGTLKRLRSRNKSAAKDGKVSKQWSKKITSSQKLRELELQELVKKYSKLPPKEREEALTIHKQQIAREQALEAKEFDQNYHPEVDIEYRDAKGNLTTPRQAFKELSRAFHGSN